MRLAAKQGQEVSQLRRAGVGRRAAGRRAAPAQSAECRVPRYRSYCEVSHKKDTATCRDELRDMKLEGTKFT